MTEAARSFGWAVIGPGRIAHRFAGAVTALPAMHLQAVWGRSLAKAEAFAQAWPNAGPQAGMPEASVDLQRLLNDPQVHGVYIATPHAQHLVFAQQALQAGKPVLCEKPLVPNERQGQALVSLARERGVFLMEAVWTRYLPIYDVVAEWLRSGAIGELRSLQSSFCFHLPYDPSHRCYAPELAGGALLDIGIYNLTATRWVLAAALGHCPEPLHLHTRALLAPTGVDQRLHVQMEFEGGVSSQFVCGFDGWAENTLNIQGEHGHIVVHDGFWHSTRASLHRGMQPSQEVTRPFLANGFEGEVAAAVEAVRHGQLEEPRMPHDETMATLRWMDRIRAQAGVRYPFE